ncbi:MAG: chemotaxis protein CheD [Candidatus Melainabacteria bacterium]|nr:chemotaxis protein CheD [Candidatus Melainabacteria bacterium]
MSNVQTAEVLKVGDIKVANTSNRLWRMLNVGSSLVVVIYDRTKQVAAAAHILLPDSTLTGGPAPTPPSGEEGTLAKFADQAIPVLIQQFESLGGQKLYASVKMAGGAQMFNFGGGGGNPLNIGSRNAIAARAALSRLALGVEKTDVGGNKVRNLTFSLENGLLHVAQLGGRDLIL